MDLRIINLSSIHGDSGSTPGLTQWVKDPLLLWLWHRLSAAAQIQPLALELLYVTSMGLKSKKEKKRNKENRQKVNLDTLKRNQTHENLCAPMHK